LLEGYNLDNLDDLPIDEMEEFENSLANLLKERQHHYRTVIIVI
jgi:hypothetical protein